MALWVGNSLGTNLSHIMASPPPGPHVGCTKPQLQESPFTKTALPEGWEVRSSHAQKGGYRHSLSIVPPQPKRDGQAGSLALSFFVNKWA